MTPAAELPPAAGGGAPSRAGAGASADADDVSELGVLGPLRGSQSPQHPLHPISSHVPSARTGTARKGRQLLVRGSVGGALTGAAAVGIAYGFLAAAAADVLEAAGISPGATLAVSIAYGLMAGAVQGAIVGALTAYYGGGMWTGVKVGAALGPGMSLTQMVVTGGIATVTGPVLAVTLGALALAGAALGALVGVTVEALAPTV
jgi:hypothetical protein